MSKFTDNITTHRLGFKSNNLNNDCIYCPVLSERLKQYKPKPKQELNNIEDDKKDNEILNINEISINNEINEIDLNKKSVLKEENIPKKFINNKNIW